MHFKNYRLEKSKLNVSRCVGLKTPANTLCIHAFGTVKLMFMGNIKTLLFTCTEKRWRHSRFVAETAVQRSANRVFPEDLGTSQGWTIHWSVSEAQLTVFLEAKKMLINNVSFEEAQACHQLSSSSCTLLISSWERNKNKTSEHPFKSVHLNTERSYITGLRCSACQSQSQRTANAPIWLAYSLKSNFSKLQQDSVFLPVLWLKNKFEN